MAEIIWESQLDGVFDCKVERIDERVGRLTVIDQFDRMLLNKEVGLSYGAMFGPDVSDIALWEDMIIKVIDA